MQKTAAQDRMAKRNRERARRAQRMLGVIEGQNNVIADLDMMVRNLWRAFCVIADDRRQDFQAAGIAPPERILELVTSMTRAEFVVWLRNTNELLAGFSEQEAELQKIIDVG